MSKVLSSVNTPVIERCALITGMDTPMAKRLKEVRKLRGLTQTELAHLAKVSQGTIGNIESGSRGYGGSVVAIAEVLEVNPHWLSTGEGDMNARDYRLTAEPGHYELPKPPARVNEPSPAAMELAMLYDEIPATDRIRRAMAYNAASAAILDVLQEKQSSGA